MTRGSAAAGVAVAPIAAIGMLLVMPSVALADNCSSLGDCWSTAAGAASAALGAAVGGLGGLFGAGGTAGAGAGGGGSSTGGGAGSRWPAPPAPQQSAPEDHYPFPAPGEPGGQKEALKRVRDRWKDIRTGKAPPRTIEDSMRDLEKMLPQLKLDMDEDQRQHSEEWEKQHGTDRAMRG